MASDFGSLPRLPAHLHERFDTDAMSLDDADSTMVAWCDVVITRRVADERWPAWVNIPSKVGQVATAARRRRDRRDPRGRPAPD